mmetsp:Transcript_9726/g.31188  ORF Transcript_9726/g.31188 Transcript_9726/m.31188 type:complete len:128 (-) Transcript_9726:897-1280(-)
MAEQHVIGDIAANTQPRHVCLNERCDITPSPPDIDAVTHADASTHTAITAPSTQFAPTYDSNATPSLLSTHLVGADETTLVTSNRSPVASIHISPFISAFHALTGASATGVCTIGGNTEIAGETAPT